MRDNAKSFKPAKPKKKKGRPISESSRMSKILNHIKANGGASISELSKVFGCCSADIRYSLDKLKKRGVVMNEPVRWIAVANPVAIPAPERKSYSDETGTADDGEEHLIDKVGIGLAKNALAEFEPECRSSSDEEE